MHRSTCSQSSSKEERVEEASSEKAAKPQCIWTEADEMALIDILSLHRAEAGDGGNFKEAIFNAAADEMKSVMTIGPERTSFTSRSKWDHICHKCLPSYLV